MVSQSALDSMGTIIVNTSHDMVIPQGVLTQRLTVRQIGNDIFFAFMEAKCQGLPPFVDHKSVQRLELLQLMQWLRVEVGPKIASHFPMSSALEVETFNRGKAAKALREATS